MKRAAMGGSALSFNSNGESTREKSSTSSPRGRATGEVAKGCRRGSMKVSFILNSSATYLGFDMSIDVVGLRVLISLPFFTRENLKEDFLSSSLSRP